MRQYDFLLRSRIGFLKIKAPEDRMGHQAPDVKFLQFKNPVSFLFLVTQCVNTKCKDVSHATVLPGNRVVVCCKKHEQWKLAVYDIQSGAELTNFMLSELPSGMSSVLLDRKLCLAVSYL